MKHLNNSVRQHAVNCQGQPVHGSVFQVSLKFAFVDESLQVKNNKAL